jgi:hypothetical protein
MCGMLRGVSVTGPLQVSPSTSNVKSLLSMPATGFFETGFALSPPLEARPHGLVARFFYG